MRDGETTEESGGDDATGCVRGGRRWWSWLGASERQSEWKNSTAAIVEDASGGDLGRCE